MKKKVVLAAISLALIAVLCAAGIWWREIAVRLEVMRLGGNAPLQDEWLELPEDSIRGRAVRVYFRERPAEVVRRLIGAVRSMARKGDMPVPPELESLEGQDRAMYGLTVEAKEPETPVSRRMLPFFTCLIDRADGEGGFQFIARPETEWAPLQGVLEIMRICDERKAGLAEYPGWGFEISNLREGDLLAACVKGWAAGLDARADDEVRLGWGVVGQAAHWTGKEVLALGYPNGAALDPVTGKWRGIRGNLRKVVTWCAGPLNDGGVVTSSSIENGRIAFDVYRPDKDQWSSVGEVGPEDLGSPAEFLNVVGAVGLGNEGLVFVQPADLALHLKGVRIDPSGRMKPINLREATFSISPFPFDTTIHAFGGKVLVWGKLNSDSWGGGIWDAVTDRWESLPEASWENRPNNYFSDLSTGEEVIKISKDDAIAFCFRDRSLRKVPLPESARAEGDLRVGWTGREAWIWSRSSQGLLDIHTGAWRAFPPGGPSPRSGPTCVWTGSELVVIGGSDPPRFYNDAWAFNPQRGTWRRLDNVPRFRTPPGAARQ